MATTPMTATFAALRCTRELAMTRMTEPPGLRPRLVTLKHAHRQHQPHLPLQQHDRDPRMRARTQAVQEVASRSLAFTPLWSVPTLAPIRLAVSNEGLLTAHWVAWVVETQSKNSTLYL